MFIYWDFLFYMVMVKGLCLSVFCYGMERALQNLMAEKPADTTCVLENTILDFSFFLYY